MRRRRAPLAALLALAFACLGGAPTAIAQGPSDPGSQPPPPRVGGALPPTPEGFALSARDAIRVADRDPNVAEQAAEHGRLQSYAEATAPYTWQVGYYAGDTEVAQVLVDATTGSVRESWTGYQVAWQMARGYEGQFGHKLNAPYVWIPLCLIFFFGLFDFRRARKLVHLDLAVLLSFGVSHVFFNAGDIGVSVPLVYPPLVYLLARMAWIGWRGAGEGLHPLAPIAWLAVATVFLIGFRVALNIADSGVIDVGYAGVIGADKVADGEPLYGDGAFPEDNSFGDTYGPANYFAYVPFEQAFSWSGEWDALRAGHAAAICFDLAAIVGLFFLGRRIGAGNRRAGNAVGTILSFAWVAYPYTAFALQSNSNDSLVAALLVWAFVAFASPAGRGALLAVAAMVKFAPLALVPLFAAGDRGLLGRLSGWRPRWRAMRPVAASAIAFAAVTALLLVHPLVEPGLATFYERTIENQLDRSSPFSAWGQEPSLDWLQTAIKIGALALALAVALVPRRRTLPQLAALSAAVLIASQLAIDHWFYLYLPWFFGLTMVAITRPSVSE